MGLPELRAARGNQKRMMLAFGGVNYAEGAREGELRESEGLSSAEFPAISQRKGREEVRKCTAPNAIFAWGKLCVVDGTSLLYDGKPMGTVTDGPKEFAVINTRLCIFPDKKYLDLENLTFGNLDESVTSAPSTAVTFATNAVTLQPDEVTVNNREIFLEYIYVYNGIIKDRWVFVKTYDEVSWDAATGAWNLTGEKEMNITNASGRYVMLCKSEVSGAYTINTKTIERESNVPVHENPYVENNKGFYARITGVETEEDSEWQSTFYTRKVSYEVHNGANTNRELEECFAAGDRVDISGCTLEALKGNNKEKAIVKAVKGYTITFADGTFTAGTETAQITLRRGVPDLKFICESGNRLWGCEGHTIWASALGDPKNFYVYDGPSTGSYTVAVGTDGEFTGCVSYSGAVLFWKEQCLHKAMGAYPAEYAVFTYNIDGVQAGSHKSLEIVNEVLYYKGRSGVYAYTGGTPLLISAALGNRRYGGAAGGSDGRRYYISMREGAPSEAPPPAPARAMPRGARVEKDAQWGLYVYDIPNRLWLREGSDHILAFANLDGVLHALNAAGEVWKLEQGSGEAVEWMAEFAPFTEEAMERKRPLRLLLRMELDAGATVLVEVKHDMGPWRRVWSTGGNRSRTFTIPLAPRRCDRYAVRISGVGRCKLLRLEREYQTGGIR